MSASSCTKLPEEQPVRLNLVLQKCLHLSVLMALSTTVTAEVRRVPQDYATIQAAFSAAVNGDEILVAPGTYTGAFLFPAKNIRFRSSDGAATTILQGTGALGQPVLMMAPGTTLGSIVEGFTITGGVGVYGGGINIQNGGSAKILHNRIIGNTATAEGAGIYSYATNVIHVEGNLIAENSSGGARAGAMTAINGASIVRNNVFANNSAGSGGAIYAVVGQVLRLTNCTFYGNSASSGPAIDGDGSVVLENCILWNHAGNPIRITGSSSASALYTCVQDGSSWTWTGNGCITNDPLFADAANRDFRLQAGSPAINAGNPAPAFNDVDGSRNDMGATGGPYASTPTSGGIRWTRKASMPIGRRNTAAVACGDAIYTFGGWPSNSETATRTVQMYEPASNMWTILPDLPGNSLRDAAAVELDGSVYLLGGYLYDYAITDQLLRFDPRSGSWTTCTRIPDARLGASVHALHGKLYVLGGRKWTGGWSSYNTCWIYDPSLEGTTAGPWSRGADISLATPLGDNSGIALRGDLFTFGSYEPSVPSRFTTYSPRANMWRQLPALPLTAAPATARAGDWAYLLDRPTRVFRRFSYSQELSASRGLMLVTPPTINLEQLESAPESLPSGRLVAHRNRIFLIGGGAPNAPSDSCWMYQ